MTALLLLALCVATARAGDAAVLATASPLPAKLHMPNLPRTIEVIGREGWGATAPGPGLEAHAILRVSVHHTAARLDQATAVPARIRQHQAFHQSKGWPDLAYHFVVDPGGNIYEGRSLEARGDTATNYDTTGHLLIVLEGNYEEQEPTEAQLDSVAHLVAWAVEVHGVRIEDVRGHRDLAATLCPGEAVYQHLADGSLQARARAAFAERETRMRVLRGPDALERVAEIENALGRGSEIENAP